MTNIVGKIYSDALYSLSAEENCTEEICKELLSLEIIWRENPLFVKVLSAPTVNLGEKIEIIKTTFEGRVSEIVLNFLCVIVEKNRAIFLPEISNGFKELWYEEKGIAEITVTTATKLTENARVKLIEKLKTKYNKDVILEEKIDPEIIGGMIVRYGNSMLDGSVRRKLDAIEGQINGTIA